VVATIAVASESLDFSHTFRENHRSSGKIFLKSRNPKEWCPPVSDSRAFQFLPEMGDEILPKWILRQRDCEQMWDIASPDCSFGDLPSGGAWNIPDLIEFSMDLWHAQAA
jgi:hypothetical protein